MSITELRLTPDKSGKDAIICDVAIHPDFFRKVEALIIFRDFLITIIFEALDTKYKIQINRDSWIILKNRKSMGVLVKHRVQNRDVQKVYESYQNPTKNQKTLLNELKSDGFENKRSVLITEIEPKASKSIEKGKGLQKSTNSAAKSPVIQPIKTTPNETFREVNYCLFKTTSSPPFAIIEFFLPAVMAPDEISLDLGRDRIVLEARRAGYSFDSFFPFDVDADKATTDFNGKTHVSFNLE